MYEDLNELILDLVLSETEDIIELETEDIFWRHSYSQGDGMCFDFYVAQEAALILLLKTNIINNTQYDLLKLNLDIFEINIETKKNIFATHYCHNRTRNIDISIFLNEDTDDLNEIIEWLHSDIVLNDLHEWYRNITENCFSKIVLFYEENKELEEDEDDEDDEDDEELEEDEDVEEHEDVENLKDKKLLKIGDVFKHYKNTCYFYCIQDFAKIQKDNIWIDAVIYTRLYDSPNIKFVRSKEEFIQKFNKVQIQELDDSADKFIS